MVSNSEIIVDLFAGGGGASAGIEMALGRTVDVAVNHDPLSIEMHTANHPWTRHYCESVFDVDRVKACGGSPVGLLWLSPDCRHFSRAKGSVPVSPKIRSLAWVGIEWAEKVRPRVICLENVPEFLTWGPLTEDGRPDQTRSGETFREFVARFVALGYDVEWRVLNAADFGAPTSRKRLFLVARCDGREIVWPDPTHGQGRIPYRTAAECIDWSIPCKSIFREKPLADATMRRIARGLVRFVLQAENPFVVDVAGIPAATMIDRQFSQSAGNSVSDPLGSITAGGGGKSQLVAAFLAKHYGGVTGHELTRPLGTITAVDHHSLVAAHLTKFYGTSTGSGLTEPTPTITGQGGHIGLVAAFLVHYYGQGTQGQDLKDPMHTIVTKARHGLVTVTLEGQEYIMTDIGMRMLEPHELAKAQGFPSDYILTGNKSQKIARIGNSVCPPVAAAVVGAQFGVEQPMKEAA